MRIANAIRQRFKTFVGSWDRSPSWGWTTPSRELLLWNSFQYLGNNRMAGSYCEFGVWRGDTFATAIRMVDKLESAFPCLKPTRFNAFDSFEGFQEPKGKDKHPLFQAGGRAFSTAQFVHLAKSRGIEPSRYRMIQGWFNQSLPRCIGSDDVGEIALAYVDCDLLESTRDVLPYIASRMIKGGVVAFDNWFCFAGDPSSGEQGALNEFLAANRSVTLIPFRNFGWHGRAFLWHSRIDGSTTQM